MISSRAAKKLRSLYLNEHVVIYLKGMSIATVDVDEQQVSLSAMVEGYVIDVDQDFIYIGGTDGAITKTVNHDIAQYVEILTAQGDLVDLGFPDGDVH